MALGQAKLIYVFIDLDIMTCIIRINYIYQINWKPKLQIGTFRNVAMQRFAQVRNLRDLKGICRPNVNFQKDQFNGICSKINCFYISTEKHTYGNKI